MQKLTKEQAADLIEKLNTKYYVSTDGGAPYEVRSIINQCTEKEFPGFEINDNDEVIKISSNGEHETVLIDVPDTIIGISYEKFKEFTDGCNKIVGYINAEVE